MHSIRYLHHLFLRTFVHFSTFFLASFNLNNFNKLTDQEKSINSNFSNQKQARLPQIGQINLGDGPKRRRNVQSSHACFLFFAVQANTSARLLSLPIVLADHQLDALLIELNRLKLGRQLRKAHVLAEALVRTELDQLLVDALRGLAVAHLHLNGGHRLQRLHTLAVDVERLLGVLVGRLEVAPVHTLLGQLQELLDRHLAVLLLLRLIFI